MRIHSIFVLLFVSFIVAGCGQVSILYRTVDLFIEQYADDYLSLDSSQLASWNPDLADALARHRREELPHLAAFFDGLYRETRGGFETAGTDCLIGAFEDIYRRHFHLAAGVAAPLLVSLRPRQVRALERKFAEDTWDKAKESPARVEHRRRRRAERWSEYAEWWIGPLSGVQREIIREITAAMPDVSAEWAAYRSAHRTELIRLLDGNAEESEIRRYLTNWLAYHRELPPSLQAARKTIRRQIVRLFVRLDASFSKTQRTHLEERLAGFRDDLMDVQTSPRLVSLRCAE